MWKPGEETAETFYQPYTLGKLHVPGCPGRTGQRDAEHVSIATFQKERKLNQYR